MKGALIVFLPLLAACGGHGNSLFDWTAPAPISDLTTTDSLGTSITLTWTASGDDDQSGTAAAYDLRQALQPITEANWDDAEQVAGVPHPGESGASQELTVTHLAWWTRYYFAVRVRDDAGNWSDLSNVTAASPYPEADLRFVVQTRGGIVAIDMQGRVEPFVGGSNPIDVLGDRVYVSHWGDRIDEYHLNGSLSRSIPIPGGLPWYTGFAALPGGRFALMSNEVDTVYFIDDAGKRLGAASIVESANPINQNLDGVVVGDSLVISEDGYNHLLRADLRTYQTAVFYNLSYLSGWLGAIDYSDGYYYLCQAQTIYRFNGSRSHLVVIATLGSDLYNIAGVVVAGGHSFVALNFAGAIYRVNNQTGLTVPFVTGLDYPEDLELAGR